MSELTNSPIADFDWDSYEHGQVETGKTREELMKTYDESLNTVKGADGQGCSHGRACRDFAGFCR